MSNPESPPATVAAAEPASDHLRRLRSGVAALTLPDPRGQRSQDAVLAALDRLPQPLSEHAGPVHVTASAIVTGPRGVLLHRHKRLDRWLQPGGHIEPGEAPWHAARRETGEETGIAARLTSHDPVHVDVHPGGRDHRHLDIRYLLHADGAEPDPPDSESQQVVWFAWPEAVACADDGLIGALRMLAP